MPKWLAMTPHAAGAGEGFSTNTIPRSCSSGRPSRVVVRDGGKLAGELTIRQDRREVFTLEPAACERPGIDCDVLATGVVYRGDSMDRCRASDRVRLTLSLRSRSGGVLTWPCGSGRAAGVVLQRPPACPIAARRGRARRRARPTQLDCDRPDACARCRRCSNWPRGHVPKAPDAPRHRAAARLRPGRDAGPVDIIRAPRTASTCRPTSSTRTIRHLFSTNWCGGVARRARAPAGHRSSALRRSRRWRRWRRRTPLRDAHLQPGAGPCADHHSMYARGRVLATAQPAHAQQRRWSMAWSAWRAAQPLDDYSTGT